MRAPSPSFRDALTFVRGVVEETSAGPVRELVLQMLKDWEDAPAEKIWETITDASVANGMPPPKAVEFIEWIVVTRVNSENASQVVEQWPAEKAKRRTQAKRALKGGPNEWADAAVKGHAVEAFEAHMDAALGRKKGGAPRQRFMQILSETFMTNCGRPLDKVVAALTEIAFGPAATEDVVRKARKRRDR
jgi:hypothetical protein